MTTYYVHNRIIPQMGVKMWSAYCVCTLVYKYCKHLFSAINIYLCGTHKMFGYEELTFGNANVFLLFAGIKFSLRVQNVFSSLCGQICEI